MKEAIDMGKKIMVVDDSRMIALQMQNLLEDTEYEIAAYCRNGEDALAKYGEIRPDIVTMDIIMPGMDGLETAQALLERGILSKCPYGYKVLGNGKITKKVTVQASAFSKSAQEAIEAAGGKAEVK